LEKTTPWTAIIPLNEEYYIAQREKMIGHTLPLIHLKSRKNQQEGHPTLLPSKPWERYVSKETTNLYINLDKREPAHESFVLQEQAKRDRERGLKAVFIDELTLQVPYEVGKDEHTHFEVDFKLCRTPKISETKNKIQEQVLKLKNDFGLYPDISKKDTAFYSRIFQNPSCLEISEIRQVASPFVGFKNEYLNGLTNESQLFLCNLNFVTHDLVWDAFKRFDSHGGFVLDGLVPSTMINERLKESKA
jgi:hypothetical protein